MTTVSPSVSRTPNTARNLSLPSSSSTKDDGIGNSSKGSTTQPSLLSSPKSISMIQQASQRAQREINSDYQHHVEHVKHYHEHLKPSLPDVFHTHHHQHDPNHPPNHHDDQHHYPPSSSSLASALPSTPSHPFSHGRNTSPSLSSPERGKQMLTSSSSPSSILKLPRSDDRDHHHHPQQQQHQQPSSLRQPNEEFTKSVSVSSLLPNLSATARKLNQPKGVIARKHHRMNTYCNREGYLSLKYLWILWFTVFSILMGVPLCMDTLHSIIDTVGLYSGLRTVSVFTIYNNTANSTNAPSVLSTAQTMEIDTNISSTDTDGNGTNDPFPSTTDSIAMNNTSNIPVHELPNKAYYAVVSRYIRKYIDNSIIIIMKYEALLHITYMRNIHSLIQSLKRNIGTDFRYFLFNFTIKSIFSSSSVIALLNVFAIMLVIYRINLSTVTTIGGQVSPYLFNSNKVAVVWVTSIIYLVTSIALAPLARTNDNALVRNIGRIFIILVIVSLYTVLYTIYSVIIGYFFYNTTKTNRFSSPTNNKPLITLPFTVRTVSGFSQFLWISTVTAFGISVFTLLMVSIVQSMNTTIISWSTMPEMYTSIWNNCVLFIQGIFTSAVTPVVYSIFCFFLLSTLHTKNVLVNVFIPVTSAAVVALVICDCEYTVTEDNNEIHHRFPLRDTIQELWKHLDSSLVARLQTYSKSDGTVTSTAAASTSTNENADSNSTTKVKTIVHPFPELTSWTLGQSMVSLVPSTPSMLHVSVLSQLSRACLLSLSEEDQFRYLYDLPVLSLSSLPILNIPTWLHSYVDIHSSTPLAASTPLPIILIHIMYWCTLGLIVRILNYYNQGLFSWILGIGILTIVYIVIPSVPETLSFLSPALLEGNNIRIEGYSALAYISQALSKLGKLTDDHLFEAIIESLQLTKDMEYIYTKEDSRISKVWPPNHKNNATMDKPEVSCFCHAPEIPLAPVTPYQHRLRYNKAGISGSNKVFGHTDYSPETLLPLLLHIQNQTLHDENGSTKLHFACLQGLPDGVRLLLEEKQMDMDVLDREGNTPLHIALANKHGECANILISKGCNIHIRNIHGIAPLHLAIEHGLTHTAALLLQKGASVSKESISMNAHRIDDKYLPISTPSGKSTTINSMTTPSTNGKRVNFTSTVTNNNSNDNGSVTSTVTAENNARRVSIFGPKPELGSSIARSTLPTAFVNSLLKNPLANPPPPSSQRKTVNTRNMPQTNIFSNPSAAASIAKAALVNFAYDK